MKTGEHPNIALVKRLDPANITGTPDLFAENAVWHFFNPKLPDVQGDYAGINGIEAFFAKLTALTQGSFHIEPVNATAVGDELVVMHTRNSLVLDDVPVALDAVLVWRIVDGRIAEVWDIPAVHMEHAA